MHVGLQCECLTCCIICCCYKCHHIMLSHTHLFYRYRSVITYSTPKALQASACNERQKNSATQGRQNVKDGFWQESRVSGLFKNPGEI